MSKYFWNEPSDVVSRYPLSAIVIAAVVIGVIVGLWVKVPETVDVAGKALPSQEWLLSRNEEGAVLATLRDYRSGYIENYTVFSITRGDAFRFGLESRLKLGDMVSAGDTIVRIFSHELLREASRLAGEIAIARAGLATGLTGEKSPVIREAQRTLALANENADLQNRLFQRQDSLFRKDYISREAFELSRTASQLATLQAAVAEARLQTVETGLKPEQIHLMESQISALEAQIRVLTGQLGAMTLVAPLSGCLLSLPGTDTLCVVEDTTRVVIMMVPVERVQRIARGQAVRFTVSRLPGHWSGVVQRVDRRARMLLGRQVVEVVASVGDTLKPPPSDLTVIGTIEIARVSLAQYLVDWFVDLFSEIMYGTTGV